MSYVFGALLEILWELTPDEVFKLCITVGIHSVPKLGASLMNVINRLKVHVLLVPPEHCFPGAHVNIGRIDPEYLQITESFAIRNMWLDNVMGQGILISDIIDKYIYVRIVSSSDRFHGMFLSKRL